MRVTTTPWGPICQHEANKLWFYAIFVSILLDLYEIWTALSRRGPLRISPVRQVSVSEKSPSNEVDPTRDLAVSGSTPNLQQADTKLKIPMLSCKQRDSVSHRRFYKQFTVDCCNLVIPGAAVGWINADPVTVGVATIITSVIPGIDIWNKVNRPSG